MKATDILQIYKASSFLSLLKEFLKKDNARVQLKNLNGSADALITSTYISESSENHLFVVRDREEANYLQNDIENLTGKEVFLFPGSYKRPYHFEEVDNANVLQRAEVLKQVNENRKGSIIISFPDAFHFV